MLAHINKLHYTSCTITVCNTQQYITTLLCLHVLYFATIKDGCSTTLLVIIYKCFINHCSDRQISVLVAKREQYERTESIVSTRMPQIGLLERYTWISACAAHMTT